MAKPKQGLFSKWNYLEIGWIPFHPQVSKLAKQFSG